MGFSAYCVSKSNSRTANRAYNIIRIVVSPHKDNIVFVLGHLRQLVGLVDRFFCETRSLDIRGDHTLIHVYLWRRRVDYRRMHGQVGV